MRLWKHWTRRVGHLLEEAADTLASRHIGIAEMDIGNATLWVGGEHREDRYQGVQVRVSENHYFVVILEFLCEASFAGPEEALRFLLERHRRLMEMGQDNVRLTYDEGNLLWVLEAYRECNGREDLANRVEQALNHPLSLEVDEEELVEWREANPGPPPKESSP